MTNQTRPIDPNINAYEGLTIRPEGYVQWATIGGSTGIGSTARASQVKQRAGCIKITSELLKKLMGIPEDVDIIGIYMDQNAHGAIGINVRSNNLPEIDEGMYLPHVTIQQLSGYDE